MPTTGRQLKAVSTGPARHTSEDQPPHDRRAELIERQRVQPGPHRDEAVRGQVATHHGLELLHDVVKIERPREGTTHRGPTELDVFLDF